jgi:nitrile hydratase accessory protein
MNNQSNFNLPFTNLIEDQITFQNPWHGQVFAITVQLSENGNFSWTEFVEIFGNSLKEARLKLSNLNGNDDYFNCWLTALEKMIIFKKLGNIDVLSLLKEDWTKAYLSTPHGKPVKIKNRSV